MSKTKTKPKAGPRITIRLDAAMDAALTEAAESSGLDRAVEARKRLAKSLKIKEPDLRVGAAGHREGCECVTCTGQRRKAAEAK